MNFISLYVLLSLFLLLIVQCDQIFYVSPCPSSVTYRLTCNQNAFSDGSIQRPYYSLIEALNLRIYSCLDDKCVFKLANGQHFLYTGSPIDQGFKTQGSISKSPLTTLSQSGEINIEGEGDETIIYYWEQSISFRFMEGTVSFSNLQLNGYKAIERVIFQDVTKANFNTQFTCQDVWCSHCNNRDSMICYDSSTETVQNVRSINRCKYQVLTSYGENLNQPAMKKTSATRLQ